ncbi:cytochrome b5 [Hymenobacter busanensis]|uniref:Cytochrome b5 n=1 Tax=Hymenobacter busanensis TaxID=2607656 RepID=A0A7L5A0B2_9BACT|nr:cytochrome b5 [Hymenobacter busanensis]QHJ08717.1 cytochrome b5 [Hymenobacter busanensis]
MSVFDTPPPHVPATATGQPVADLPEYTVHQLALRNGQDRDDIWFAYRGLIYDVTSSRLWRRGNHYEHWAGQDLTAEMDKDAPHTVNVLDKFYVVGRLKQANT